MQLWALPHQMGSALDLGHPAGMVALVGAEFAAGALSGHGYLQHGVKCHQYALWHSNC